MSKTTKKKAYLYPKLVMMTLTVLLACWFISNSLNPVNILRQMQEVSEVLAVQKDENDVTAIVYRHEGDSGLWLTLYQKTGWQNKELLGRKLVSVEDEAELEIAIRQYGIFEEPTDSKGGKRSVYLWGIMAENGIDEPIRMWDSEARKILLPNSNIVVYYAYMIQTVNDVNQ